MLDLSEVKCDVTGSRGLPVSTSRPNLVKISQKAPELWQFMCFQNGGRRHLEFTSGVDFLYIGVFGWWRFTFLLNLISLPHSVAELLMYVQKFKMAAVRHLELLFGYSGPPTKFYC